MQTCKELWAYSGGGAKRVAKRVAPRFLGANAPTQTFKKQSKEGEEKLRKEGGKREMLRMYFNN